MHRTYIIIFSLLLAVVGVFAGETPDSAYAARVGILRYEPEPERHIVMWRLGVFSATALGLGGYGYSRMDDWWGHEFGPAHIKHNDWNGDDLVQTDEVSHLVISYKMTQAGVHFARWTGFSDATSRWIGGGIAGAIMTWVEYPVDTYNPIQGFGYTDMTANIIGITLALSKDRWPEKLDWFDLRVSVKEPGDINSEIIAQTFAQNDAFIYWLTVSPVRRFPVHAAVGYSANHNTLPDNEAEREVYIGFGTSLGELAGMVNNRWRGKLDLWNFYELSISFRVD